MEKSSSYIPTSKVNRSCSYGQMSLRASNAFNLAFLMKCKYICIRFFYLNLYLGEGLHRLCLLPNPFEFFNKYVYIKDHILGYKISHFYHNIITSTNCITFRFTLLWQSLCYVDIDAKCAVAQTVPLP